MALLTLGISPVLSGSLERPHRGSWTADLEVDADAAPTGTLHLTGAGIDLVGTVITSQSWNDRQRARVVAGAGGMRATLKPAWFRAVTLRTILKSILDGAGETLSATSDAPTLARLVPAWVRLGGLANALLDQVLAVYAPTAIWRHLPDGTIWVGVPTWPTVTTAAIVQDNRGDDDAADLAGDDIALDAGVTVLDRRVGFVRHSIIPTGLRTEAWWVSSAPRGIIAAVTAIVERLVGARIDMSRPYAARVVSQHADGSLDLVPDSPRVPPLTSVPICYGEPGVSAKVKAGARVFVEFADGDPSKPFVTGWTAGAVDTLTISADHVRIADGDLALARRGDIVQVVLPAIMTGVGPAAYLPGVDPSPLAKAYGTIISGSTKATSS